MSLAQEQTWQNLNLQYRASVAHQFRALRGGATILASAGRCRARLRHRRHCGARPRADATKLNLDVELGPGPVLQRLVSDLYDAPQDVIQIVKKAM
jgi:hypothetical protein